MFEFIFQFCFILYFYILPKPIILVLSHGDSNIISFIIVLLILSTGIGLFNFMKAYNVLLSEYYYIYFYFLNVLSVNIFLIVTLTI
mgnify:CR=1 FL=1